MSRNKIITEKIADIILCYFRKINQLNLIEAQSNLDAIPLSDQTKFRLNEINKSKDYFNSKIQDTMTMRKKHYKVFGFLDICN